MDQFKSGKPQQAAEKLAEMPHFYRGRRSGRSRHQLPGHCGIMGL
jgi:hypothetical protein